MNVITPIFKTYIFKNMFIKTKGNIPWITIEQ